MKYLITGSLGNISSPLTQTLVQAGQDVTVISSNADKKSAIEALGAKAAIGSVADEAFLTQAFQQADAVYLMIPNDFSKPDYPTFQRKIADLYVKALSNSSIQYVVLLSSIGAHLRKGAGPIDGLAYLEEKLQQLTDLNIQVLRPSYFYYNLFSLAGLIKNAGIAGNNFGNTEEKLVLTHTSDIADVAAEELLKHDFEGYHIRYIASDERHPSEIAAVLGQSVGKENTPWVPFTDEQSREGMLAAGVPPVFTELYVDMGKAIREGKLQEDYWKNRPVLGKVKLEDFAQEFAGAYQQG
ncbi:NAD(P)H-binding protein [Siphonobacter sp. SORGH_AS_0500]|uniref:NAD(P)H-binding protein n=1 Tax=Siphonobacter sp. SORGH_AS_0500 TaxID=1864824 RepID=UPI000CA84193|nr:NAD(P)H-binding protein [Siphonobacter sp. SORGH_AS_0500]MDR6195295.1 uncharacterized protein YbjT (DUF2867 family) [Siphonobacter sp. SORGH_AS_0500]PKK38253.1 NAD-dependent dehydratase [Siphonobacter sp. SORGH_AS_0500]